MPRLLLLAALLFAATLLYSQSTTSLTDFNTQRLQRQRTAMLVLGGWAVGNIASGLALRGRHTGSERYFHDMNVYWNLVNLGLAGFSYFSLQGTDPAALDLYTSVQQHHGFQKILLLNTGLDVGYMLGGAYLIERAKNRPENAERLRGFGRSIVLQGGFLFAFDLVNYFIQAGQNEQLRVFMPGEGAGMGLQLTF